MIHSYKVSQIINSYNYVSAGKHFTYRSLEDEDVLFVKAHKTACDLLSEARPNYGDRRLGSHVRSVIFSEKVI